jgi:hypothetical protein
MPTLVHITDEKHVPAILRSGIRLSRGRQPVVYFMPVLQSHFISHQWVRELRRGGAKVLVGVYFRLSSSEPVWAGRYNQPHEPMALGEAIDALRALEDPLGFEIFMDRPVPASAIQKVRAVPPTVGWRYMPHAHGKPLCVCPACIPKGGIKSKQLKQRLDPFTPEPSSLPYVKARLMEMPPLDELPRLVGCLRNKRRRADPAFMEPLLSCPSWEVREELAFTLPYFRHPNAVRLLQTLLKDEDPRVAQAAADALGDTALTTSPGPNA